MSRILLGTICGLVYGALSAASMIPLSFPDKTAALTMHFLNRFAIGFVIRRGAVAATTLGPRSCFRSFVESA